MDKLLERFLQYVSLDTQSKPGVRQVPSTEGQWKLLRLLQAQLEEMGLVKVTLSEKGTVMGTLPANVEGDITAIGLSPTSTPPRISVVKTLIRRLLKTIAAAISRWVSAMIWSAIRLIFMQQCVRPICKTNPNCVALMMTAAAAIPMILTLESRKKTPLLTKWKMNN